MKVTLLDDTGVLWTSDSDEAREQGLSILYAAEQGNRQVYERAIGSKWTGDLVMVEEVARLRWSPA